MTNLTLEARAHLIDNPELQKKIAPMMGMLPGGVENAILRRSKSLIAYPVVLAIAESIGKEPQDILEETN
jgi:hypothetical protein